MGISSAALGLKGFLVPNHFIDGGVTGISLLVAHSTALTLPVLIFIINIPFILLAFYQISVVFALRTLVAIAGLAAALAFINFPVITQDKLLIALFGGMFLGAGVGLSIRGGCVLDGTEILALFLKHRAESSMGDIILVLNVIIFGCAAFILGIEPALYSILTYLAATRTIDYIVEGVEEYTGISIISEKNVRIKTALVTKLGQGLTIYRGKKAIIGKHEDLEGSSDMDIIFIIVTRLEISKVKRIVNEIDGNAFIYYFPISNARGGMLKKRPLHETGAAKY